MERSATTVIGRPQGPTSRGVTRYVGYEYQGFPRRAQVGLPSTRPAMIISLSDPVATLRGPAPRREVFPLQAFLVGPASAAAEIDDPGHGLGVTIELDPLVLSELFNLPAVELTNRAVSLDELMPQNCRSLVDRLAAAADWPARFCILDEILAERLNGEPRSTPDLGHAWQRLIDPEPPSVSELAATLGWSRRHFTRRFTDRVGITPTRLRRIGRIERSAPMLLDGWSIAQVAHRCGYFDQAHMTNEWRALAQHTPRSWTAKADEGAKVLDVRPHAASADG